jgi:NADPH2:quinone reductase
MKAAVVHDFQLPPTYTEFPDPVPEADELVVDLTAAALSPLSRSQASGKHYSSTGELPLIPGNDGVGRLADGRRVYFVASHFPFGAMAEKSLASTRAFLELPSSLDDANAAAIANPGMSSWAALNVQAKLVAGETVLVHGATGSAGQLATKIAKHLEAGRVIAVGRGSSGLGQVIADEHIDMDQTPEELLARLRAVFTQGVDVILDYLWGAPAELLFEAIKGNGGPAGEPRIRFVQIGTVAGPKISLAGESLRSSGLRLMGSGLGSVSRSDLLTSIAGVFQAAATSDLKVETEVVPLSEVQEAWNRDTHGKRLVFQV